MTDLAFDPEQGANAFLTAYFRRMADLLIPDDQRMEQFAGVRDLWLSAQSAGGRVLFLGNGGSAAIASHLATDLSKNGGVPALAFNDAALITCLGNDYGYENWMAHAVRLAAQPGDVLTAISSSGVSRNVLNATAEASKHDIPVITLSGFDADNPLRRKGDINLWLDSRCYNIVETIHQAWLLAVVDMIIGKAEYPAA
jgi:phosphoheptose isomerase